MSMPDRSWMYQRLDDGMLNMEFVNGIEHFISQAIMHPTFMNGPDEIRCPCKKCMNRAFRKLDEVKLHLGSKGFMSNYYVWDRHGEAYIGSSSTHVEDQVQFTEGYNSEPMSPLRQMVFDAAGPEFPNPAVEEEPNAEAKKFFDMLNACDEELWPGCEKHSVLSAIARLLNIKSENHLSESCFDTFIEFLKEALPVDNKMPANFYETKKLIQGLGLPVEKIDCCVQGCMLFWEEDSELTSCKICGQERYKEKRGSEKQKLIPVKRMYYFPLTPRLKRLYASNATACHMRWHHNHQCENGEMCHPCDAEAWRHFNDTHLSFAEEPRNVRLGMCTDGFQPFGQTGKQYSCWPIILTPYNLPPWMCMKEPYMFLTALVPGPSSPKQRLDVFLQPLVKELKHLWDVGVEAYDVSLKQNFQLRAALMWTINDFPAYAMLSGWSTHGKTACPYCMDNSQAFQLKNGGKPSWFDSHRKFLPHNHPYRNNKNKFLKNRIEMGTPPPMKSGTEVLNDLTVLGFVKVTESQSDLVNERAGAHVGWKKRSILWDLPYWETNLIRHNLDVMHIEKNVFENVFNTVLNIVGKTKDNAKARDDMSSLCKRPELRKDPRTGKYPKACYTLDRNQKKVLCEWVKSLKFPDGYVSNLARCVDERKYRLFGMKSHDCHVFMQRLLPIAFRELLPNKVWEAITELSLFFKSITASVITVQDMEQLEKEIPVILCKLETIFPPAFFDSMEHLPIHLPYEAKVAGPIQFRWMYPFERFLRHLKMNVKNKARVEGSICNAYLVEEASTFCSHYFEPHVYTRARKLPRNDDGGDVDSFEGNISIFAHPGRLYGRRKVRWLTEKEFEAAHRYVLMNCDEVEPFLKEYISYLEEIAPGLTEVQLHSEVEKHFPTWFLQYVSADGFQNQVLRDLARGPLKRVKCYPIYFTNGYKFHTKSHSGDKATSNSGVCITGPEVDYYGVIDEIIEVEYHGLPMKKTVLFKCDWFDPTESVGTRVHKKYQLVDINQRRRFNKFEPFVIAMQVTQVYYMSYPSLKRGTIDWLAVSKVKAKGVFKVDALQEDEFQVDFVNNNQTVDELVDLSDPNHELEELPDDDEAFDIDEPEFETDNEEYIEKDDIEDEEDIEEEEI